MMAKPHATGMLIPQIPVPLSSKYPTAPKKTIMQAESDTENQKPAEGRLPGQDDRR